MTHDPLETERRLQAAAEQPGARVDDAAEARHRYVLHAIRQLPIPAPPPGFAQQMEACLQDYPEDAGAETWLLRIAALAALAIGVATVGPWLASAVQALAESLGDVPWRFLGAIIGGLAGFVVFDTLRLRQAGSRRA